jgi:hypothetical protein
MLAAVSETRRADHEEDVAGAARSVLVPAINALVFAERRAGELQKERMSCPQSSVRRRGNLKKKARRD